MAEIITIATRRISGTGQIRLTTEQLKHRRYTLYADIIRKPKTPYFNRKYEPPQTFYGYISLMNQGYLLQTLPINFDAQIWIFDADITGENLIAIKCAYKGTLETFFNLGNALLLPSVSVVNTISDYKFLPLAWDNVIVKCDGDSAVQLVLKTLPYDSCDDGYKNPAPPGPPPTKPTPVPPGVPTEISPAYSADALTMPSPIDLEYVPPPQGNTCQVYTVGLRYQRADSPGTDFNVNIASFGEIGRVRISPTNGGNIELESRGNPFTQACQPFGWYLVYSVGQTLTSASVTGIS